MKPDIAQLLPKVPTWQEREARRRTATRGRRINDNDYSRPVDQPSHRETLQAQGVSRATRGNDDGVGLVRHSHADIDRHFDKVKVSILYEQHAT